MAVLKIEAGEFHVRRFTMGDDLRAAPFMDAIRVANVGKDATIVENFTATRDALRVIAIGVEPDALGVTMADVEAAAKAGAEDPRVTVLLAQAVRGDQDAIWQCYMDVQAEAGLKSPGEAVAAAPAAADPANP